MAVTLVVVLCVVVVVVAGDTRPLYDYAAPQDSVEYSPRSREVKYDFGYAVRDDFDNDFGHQESRNGDDTKGSYSVHLPDGRLQTVTYYVDGDSGYVAEVTYQGEARYPESHEVRSYVPPRPLYRAPDSDESNEAPEYIPARPSFIPRPVFTTPRPFYTPRSVYTTPRPRYTPLEPEESGETVYTPARPSFTPRPIYTSPRPIHSPPRLSYVRPEAEESSEEAVYLPPVSEVEESSEVGKYRRNRPSNLSVPSYQPPVYNPPSRSYGFP